MSSRETRAVRMRRSLIGLLLVGIPLAGSQVGAQVVGTVGTLPPAAKTGPSTEHKESTTSATTQGTAPMRYRFNP